MRTFSINTFGCKVNQYESQQIRELLEQFGLRQVETTDKPDLVVVNTCCVTHTASAKSRQSIRKARNLNFDAVIVISGCLPTVETGELGNPGENTYVIKHRENTGATLSQIVNPTPPIAIDSRRTDPDCPETLQNCQTKVIRAEYNAKIKSKNKLRNLPELPPLTSFKEHTRAFLKVQDGCDGYCGYCIVPKARPFVTSKPVEAVIEEAQALVRAGHKEIVVTGIFLGAYGQGSVRRKNWVGEQNEKLAELLEKIVEIPGLARIRLSSLEPADITPRLLDTFCKHRNIMPHLHLSLQSGSNIILKKMCRQYSADEFREIVRLIKSRLDRPAITTDIIVGFPGETEADFEATVEMAKEIGFAKMHIFSFSPRKGTAAASLQGRVDNRVIKSRSQILRDLDIELGRKFRQQFLGETDVVLIENDNGQMFGRSERYFMVYVEKTDKKLQKNDLVKVKLVENKKNGMIGQFTGGEISIKSAVLGEKV